METPSVTRCYQNHHLDSTRWEHYQPRDGDIVVTTSYKAGTTFTQTILASLLLGSALDIDRLDIISHWIDLRANPMPLEDMIADMEAQQHRRFLKSHLALDGLPWYANVKYLVVCRDPRDVFMSFANHYGNYSDVAYDIFNAEPRPGPPLPRCDPDIHSLWRNWISRGWFEWESEGYPFWGNLHHAQSYWDFRHLPNLLFLNYSDMRADLPGTIRRIASFIEEPITDEIVDRVSAEADFDAAKARAIAEDARADPEEPAFFTGGNASFIYKGTNGRWRGVLSDEELDLYEAAKTRVLDPACARWLENGGSVS